jgi:alkanesulfonate monooxygenase SsuD/methylene tetrahydromethanopterin reductase-like flavin-dependent oxidoreductase (luciferase family)
VAATPEAAAAKLADHGPRPGLVCGTPNDLAAHLRALEAAGADWAVCAPLDHTDPEVLELIAEASTLARSRP